jgi:ethanolamine permease
MDYPLPETIASVMGKNNSLTKLFAGIGLFGLVASFHGLIIGYSRQIYALARSGYLPKVLGQVNNRFRTPHWALIAGGLVGIISIYTGTTDKVITLSALGAIVMYAISMASLLKMKTSHRNEESYHAPFYPWFPIIALVLSLLCLLAIIWYNLMLSLWFLIGLVLVITLFVLSGKHKKNSDVL